MRVILVEPDLGSADLDWVLIEVAYSGTAVEGIFQYGLSKPAEVIPEVAPCALKTKAQERGDRRGESDSLTFRVCAERRDCARSGLQCTG